MNRVSLADANKIYQYADNCTIIRQRVSYTELDKFSKALYTLKGRLNEQSEDEYWKEFFRPLRQFQFDLCAAPLLNKYRDSYITQINNSLKHHLAHCRLMYPDFAESANSILSKLVNLANKAENPLLVALLNISKTYPKSNIAWVIKESRLIPHVENVITSEPELCTIKLLHSS